jgi:lipoprotein-anchoring transpeptidase ErfK/SrfK
MDKRYGAMTQHAVFAFEKVEELELDGLVGRRELRAILHSSAPKAPERAVDDFIDVDIGRQVLFEVRGGRVVHTLPISTGNGLSYSSTSGLAIAHTPRGTFQIERKIAGWRVGYLGAMYYPSYFSGGYAIHGSLSVPPYPASHGCIRIPMHSTVGFFERNPVGTEVFVHD